MSEVLVGERMDMENSYTHVFFSALDVIWCVWRHEASRWASNLGGLGETQLYWIVG